MPAPATASSDTPALQGPIPPDSGRTPTQGPTPVPAPAPDAAATALPVSDRKQAVRAVEIATSPLPVPSQADTPQNLTFALVPTPSVPEASATTFGPPSNAATPAAQIAPTLLTLATTRDGTREVTVRLHPADLGMVQIRIETGPSGVARVEITAEKADTLQALLRDEPHLHRTLDAAGIPSANRSVTFHIAPPVPVQPAQASSGSGASGQGGGQQAFAGRANSGGADANGSSGGANGGSLPRDPKPWFGGRRHDGSPAPGEIPSGTTTHRYRIGLDITA